MTEPSEEGTKREFGSNLDIDNLLSLDQETFNSLRESQREAARRLAEQAFDVLGRENVQDFESHTSHEKHTSYERFTQYA